MTKEGFSLSVDAGQLLTSLFALLPVPVAIADENGRILIANSYFSDVFADVKTMSSARLHEIAVPGRGTFAIEILPLNDQGLKIIYGIDVSKEVCLRRQVTELEQGVAAGSKTSGLRIPCDLNELVRSAVRSREPFTRAAKIAVSVDLKAQLPWVKGDPDEIEKVLTGLITNAEQAILFARRSFGAIHVRTWVEKDNVRVSVCDNGWGISTRDMYASGLDPLFEELQHRGGHSRLAGIAACAEIIKDYGGELFCWSSYNAGSTYTFELPAMLSQNSPQNS